MATVAHLDATGVATPEAIGATPPELVKDLRTTAVDRVLYGLGSIAFGVKDNGFTVLLLIFYNQALGLSAGAVGLAIMIALIVDAVGDPIIGRVNDNIRSRSGRSHLLLYAAALPGAVSYYFLWNPPAGLSHSQLFWYLLGTSIVIRVFISVYEIPSNALIIDLARDYDSRTSWFSWRWFFGYVGGMGMNIAAFSLFLRPGPHDPSGQLNLHGYATYGLVSSLLMFGAIVVSALGTQRHVRHFAPPAPRRPFVLAESAREIVRTLVNKPFVLLGFATLFSWASAGIVGATLTYFRVYLWELSGDQISGLMIGYVGALLTALWLAPWLAKRLGKKEAAIAVALTTIACSPLMYFGRVLDVVPANGSPVLYGMLFATGFVNTTLAVASGTLGSSMFADIVEYSAVKSGRHSAGLVFSANAFLLKAMSGVGVFGAGLILAFVRFPDHATAGHVPHAILTKLALTEPATIMALQIAGLLCILAFPITKRTHEENLRALDERDVAVEA